MNHTNANRMMILSQQTQHKTRIQTDSSGLSRNMYMYNRNMYNNLWQLLVIAQL